MPRWKCETTVFLKSWRSSCRVRLPTLTQDCLSLQVHLQTQQEVKRRMMGMAVHVVKSDGVLALYNGLSASLCRQVRAHSSFNVESLGGGVNT